MPHKDTFRMTKTYRLVLTALFFAVSLVLSLVENALPPLPMPVPGVKLGLANIAVMYTLFFLGRMPALSVACLKAAFAALTRGPAAGFLSLCGGLFSLGIMLLLLGLFRHRISWFLLSISGAVFHNLGQLTAVSLLYGSLSLWPYLPVLLLSGIAAGSLTAALLRVLLPALRRIPAPLKNGTVEKR